MRNILFAVTSVLLSSSIYSGPGTVQARGLGVIILILLRVLG